MEYSQVGAWTLAAVQDPSARTGIASAILQQFGAAEFGGEVRDSIHRTAVYVIRVIRSQGGVGGGAVRFLPIPIGPRQRRLSGRIITGVWPLGAAMSRQLETVEAQALKLTAEERAHLADRLLASLFEDHEVEEAWAVEVERRIEQIEGGRSKLIPAADAIARARAAIK